MNKNTLIDHLKNKKIYVVSPHFDDAILSMGMLLYALKPYRNTTIVNLFTKAHHGPYTLSAKSFIKASGYKNAVELFSDRATEDQKAVTAINAKYLNLGFTDALFRKKIDSPFLGKFIPELNHVYPTYRWHIIKKIQSCDPAPKELRARLKKVIPVDAVVFAPFGIGNHADHAIAHKVCNELFKNVFYYIDFPYDIRLNNFGAPPDGYEEIEFDTDLSIKTHLLQNYKSQINGLFTSGVVPQHKEKFFLPDNLLK